MRMNLTTGTAIAAAAVIGLALWLPTTASARVSGNCVNCHTMHNSQDGASMQFDASATPQPALTRGGCVECHTGTNLDSTGIPKVLSSAALADESTSLAGGNFYWVTAATYGDAYGHNVVGTTAEDDATLGTVPPGGVQMVDSGAVAITQMTCAGTSGCHGDQGTDGDFAAISGAHHTDDTTIDGSSTGKSFRFLDGVKGKEDADWEFTKGANDHNQYYGVSNPNTTNIGTMSNLCANCHTDFHDNSSARPNAGIGSATSPFVRHPTDLDLGDATGSEYAGYTAYNVQAPVGSEDYSTVLDTVNAAPGDATDDAVVMCISCHRAHGTPNPDLLRWDYDGMKAHDATADTGTGCFLCHTTKDDV